MVDMRVGLLIRTVHFVAANGHRKVDAADRDARVVGECGGREAVKGYSEV